MNKNFILSCPDIGVDRIKEMQNNISMWLREPALIKITEAFQVNLLARRYYDSC